MTQVFVLPYDWVIKHVSPDRIGDFLPEEEVAKGNRFIHKADRFRFIAARLFLFGLLKQQGLLKSNELKLDYNDFGKPFLKGVEIEFNWSHSGDMIAIIFGMEQCGIDIELHSGKELYDYRSLCTERELQIITQRNQQTGISEQELFFDFWTAKESVVKAKGTGLSTDPRLIEILFRQIDENNWSCKHEQIFYGRTEVIDWCDKRYSLAWCTPINNPIYPITTIDIVKEILIYI